MKVLYPGGIDYFKEYSRPQQILSELARRGHEVTYIQNTKEMFEFDEPVEIKENFFLSPPIKQMEFMKYDILYYTYPRYYYNIQKLKKVLSTFPYVWFDSVDLPEGIFAYWNFGRAHDKAITHADVVTASSRVLFDQALQLNDHSFALPNGCDYNHFSKLSRPISLSKCPGSLYINVVFMGAIHDWVDIELVKTAAIIRPDVKFYMIGTDWGDYLKDLPENVIATGHVHYENLPAYLYHADVLMIPFKIDDPMMSGVNPIKLWEYLATGKPIVTTYIPECTFKENEKFQAPIIYKSKNDHEFLNNIDKAIFETRCYYRRGWGSYFDRMKIAENNSWKKRVDIIEYVLKKKIN